MRPEQDELAAGENNRLPLYLAIGATVAGLILLTVFAFMLLRQTGADDSTATPTPFPQSESRPPRDEILVVGITDSETISVALDAPVALTVARQTIPIETQSVLPDGIWSPNLQDDTRAVWVYGSVINYIIGLRDSNQNRELLQSLAPGDNMILRTRSNISYTFAFDSRELVPVGTRDIYAQRSPGITVVLVGNESEERIVVHGRYVVDADLAGADGGDGDVPIELGETAQFGDLQLTVTGATYLVDRPEAPPGFAFYLIDFELQNVGQSAVDSARLNMVLLDEIGNQYALTPAAGQLGNNPRLSGSVAPGQSVRATAGYQIPVGLNSEVVRWQVTHTETGNQIQVAIPFSGGADAETVSVTLQQAEISLDGSSLLLVGQLANLGGQPVVVTEQDVRLTSDGTVFLILSVNPGFPWVVSPGQTQSFSVTFQRPAGSSAMFQILSQPFQLDGLR